MALLLILFSILILLYYVPSPSKGGILSTAPTHPTRTIPSSEEEFNQALQVKKNAIKLLTLTLSLSPRTKVLKANKILFFLAMSQVQQEN